MPPLGLGGVEDDLRLARQCRRQGFPVESVIGQGRGGRAGLVADEERVRLARGAGPPPLTKATRPRRPTTAPTADSARGRKARSASAVPKAYDRRASAVGFRQYWAVAASSTSWPSPVITRASSSRRATDPRT